MKLINQIQKKSKASELLEAETQGVDLKQTDQELLKRVNTKDLNVLFNTASPLSNSESLVLNADTQRISISCLDTETPHLSSADTKKLSILTADTQSIDLLAADIQAPDIFSADTQVLLAADTKVSELLTADTQALDLFAADTQAPDLLSADTQTPDLLTVDTQAPELLDADDRIRSKLSDSEIMGSSTQALVARLSDSDLVGSSTEPLGGKLSDSDLMFASTQALVAKLSESDLMGAATQALPDSELLLSDSLLLGSATQAVTSSDSSHTEGGGLHVVDSMDLLESACDSSTEDLLMLATQPVFKLPCLPMGKRKSSSSIPEPNPTLDADTEPLVAVTAIIVADTVPFEEANKEIATILDTDTEPYIGSSDGASVDCLADDTAPLGASSTETEEVSDSTKSVDEDETQCLESFTEIKNNLEAEAVAGKVDQVLDHPPVIQNVEYTDDAASDCSEDLLANEEELDLNLEDTVSEPTEGSETSRLSNTTLSSVSMVEASQPSHPSITKLMSVNNKTDFNSLSMDQTSVVESDIVSANDDTDAMSEASDNLLEDQEDPSVEEPLDLPLEITKAANPAPLAAFLLAENMDSPVFKKGRPLTPVEMAIRNNAGANDSKELCLMLDSSIEDSPIFRKKNSSVCSATQNNSGFIKSLVDDDESMDKDENSAVEASVKIPVSPVKFEDHVDAGQLINDKIEGLRNSGMDSVTKLSNPISVRRRSSTPEEVLNIVKDPPASHVRTEIIAEVVSPNKSPDADSGPLLPETQALSVDEEEISEDEDELLTINVVQTKQEVNNSGEETAKEVNVNEGESMGKGKRSRKLTPKAEMLKINDEGGNKNFHAEQNVTSGSKKVVNKSRKSINKEVEDIESDSPKVLAGRKQNKSEDLVETPFASKRLGRGKRIIKPSRKSEMNEVAETQPWVPAIKTIEHAIVPELNEEPTQPYERDPEVLLPGESGIEVDTCAETQPLGLEETVSEEPISKKSKIADGYVPPVKKSSRRSQVSKPPLEDNVSSRISKRKSAIQALESILPSTSTSADTSIVGKSRGRSMKLPGSLLLDSEEVENQNIKLVEKKKQAVNKLGRRKKLKVPDSLLIESPAAADMFVDDADSIPSPLTNGTPVIPLKTKGTRKYRTKAQNSEAVTDDLEAIVEDEPLERKKTVRSSRNSRALNNTNVQSVKPRVSRASLQQSGPSRKSLDDFSPRSKNKMTGVDMTVTAGEIQDGENKAVKKGAKKNTKESEEIEQVEPKKNEAVEDGVDMSVTAGEVMAGRETRKNLKIIPVHAKNEEPSSIKANAAFNKVVGRGIKAGEDTTVVNVELSEKSVNETVVEIKPRRGRPKKDEAIDNAAVETKPIGRGRGRKADPGNSTVAVMEAEMPEPTAPVVGKRGGRNRRTEPVEVNTELSVGRSNTSEKRMSVMPGTDTKTTGRKGRGKKDSETSQSSTVSNVSTMEVKKGSTGKAASVKKESEVTVSSSSIESRGRKRPAEETPEGSSSKKRVEDVSSSGSVRSRLNSSLDSTASPSLRKVESLIKKKQLVMFTGYNDLTDITLVKELNGSTTDSLTLCTVLVTDQIRRTAKFLSMVGRGVPIVTPMWLTESKRSGKFLDPWDFILKDPANEKKWGFKLEDTLKKASRARLLEGLKIHVTGQVKPSPEQCKDFIECGGGEFIETLPSTPLPDLYIVCCAEDKKLTIALGKLGVSVMDKEWMLSGLLKYKLDKSLKLK